jgi:hypothetical protein
VQDPHGRVFLVSHGETMPDPTKQYSKECL